VSTLRRVRVGGAWPLAAGQNRSARTRTLAIPYPLSPIPFLRARSRALGFTLIEVLAALVIVALGMMAVIQAISQTASNSSYLRDKTIAHWVALNQLTETRLQRNAPKIDETSDEVEMAGRKWRWTMIVTQTPVETMRRIDVTVRPAEADKASSMAFVTGFHGSAIAPPGSALIDWDGMTSAGQPGPGGQQDENEQPNDDPQDDETPAEEEQPEEPPPDHEPIDTPIDEPTPEQ